MQTIYFSHRTHLLDQFEKGCAALCIKIILYFLQSHWIEFNSSAYSWHKKKNCTDFTAHFPIILLGLCQLYSVNHLLSYIRDFLSNKCHVKSSKAMSDQREFFFLSTLSWSSFFFSDNVQPHLQNVVVKHFDDFDFWTFTLFLFFKFLLRKVSLCPIVICLYIVAHQTS